MHQWRITKYDPRSRNHKGAYYPDDWTSASDIGKMFNDRRFELDDYLAMENRYVSAAMHFLEKSGLSSLVVVGLETGSAVRGHSLDELLLQGLELQEGQRLSGDELARACRLNLRELLWCKLEEPGKFFIHFGYDYYMYVGSFYPCPESVRHAREIGLFVESMPSPYISDAS
jgi:hypothetical protein